MVKVRKKQKNSDVCEMSLLIERDEEYLPWDDDDLVKSIIDEVEVVESTATDIANKVKSKIKEVAASMEWDSVPTSLIREFVSNEIAMSGKKYKKKVNKYHEIGLSAKEINQIINSGNNGENSNITNNPEAVNFTIAEIILKKYALQEIFSKEVSSAHYNGDLHIHDLGSAACRNYCSGNSVEYVKKNGLKLPTVSSVSKPANSASVLVNHILTFTSSLQSQFAGAIGFDAVNTFFSPCLIGLSQKEIYQVAQELIFGYSQLSTSRGCSAIFSDLNVHIEVPNHLKKTKALGPKGKYCKIIKSYGQDVLVECEKSEASNYGEFNKYAQKFLIACMNVLESGDSRGLPFVFPKFLVHFDKNSFKEENKDVVNSVYSCASKNGSPYFLFDRGDSVKVAQCCRLSLDMTEDDFEKIKNKPEDLRFAAIQNITINIPQAALKACYNFKDAPIDKRKKETIKNIKAAMDVALLAHIQKRKHLKRIYDIDGGILSFSKNGMNNEPYVDMNNLTHLIGLIGLNETVQALTGKQLHESKEAYKLGLYIIAEMNIYCQKLAQENNIKLVLEESPSESASQRLCHISIKNKEWGDEALKIAKGDKEKMNCYWTNSVHIDNEADIDYIERLEKQSKFHPLISGGSIVHLWTGEHLPSSGSINSLVKKVYEKTQCTQFTISPEFCVCEDCGTFNMGLDETCKNCNSEKVSWYSRIVGYFAKIQNWSKNKQEERLSRKKDYSKEW